MLSDRAAFNVLIGHAVLAMITAAVNPPWPLDCVPQGLANADLSAPSCVRPQVPVLGRRLPLEST